MTALASILAATDLSAPSRQAAERAARLAHETGAALHLLHVLPGGALQELRQWLGAGHAAEEQLRQDAGHRLHELAGRLQARHPVAVHLVEGVGTVVEEIDRQAALHDAQLLVLGARGAGYLRRVLLGTTSERLLRRTTRPVLVVRQPPHEPYRQALVALDFSPWSLPSLALARRAAPHAHLVLCTAFEVPFEEKLRFAGVDAAAVEHYRAQARLGAHSRLDALAHGAGLKRGQWTPCVVEGDASLRIVEQAQEQDCDLVVLGKHGQSAAEELLLGSVTRHVLSEGLTDLLVSTARQP
ncbi:universal stress protein [Azohydromonas aeria]|uniref:universal stress protein n=1 Tax=Azohydromonas aeria TaxID=2590212 RepID=UPI0012F8783C|nr:universal stress protein [Azohydromonas aeria]